jgi:GNAT superfamily N-acetyltransferase
VDSAGELLETRLYDGTPVVVRPLLPSDRSGVAEAYRRLSPDSLYHRFWTRNGDVIGPSMLDRLLAVDSVNHSIWGLFDPARPFPLAAGASWWRSAEEPDAAEFAATVLDDDQARGIGTLLLAVLWLSAMRAGVQTFVAYVLPENRAAVRWMRDAGGTAEWDGYKVICRWDLHDLERLPVSRTAADLAARLAEFSSAVLA